MQHNTLNARQINSKNISIKKKQRKKSLILRRSRDLASDGQIGQKFSYILGARFRRMSLVVEQDKTLDKVVIGIFRSTAQMPRPCCSTHLIKQFWFINHYLLSCRRKSGLFRI